MSDTTSKAAAEPEKPLSSLFPTAGPLPDKTHKKVKLKSLPDYLPGPDPTPDLMSSMRAMGQLQEIGLVMRRDGTYQVAYGRRRIKAARRLDWSEIEAVVFPDGYANVATLALQENSTRRDNPTSEYHAINQLIKERHGVKSISQTLGLPVKLIEKRLMLRRLPDELMVALDKAQIAYGVAEAVAAMPPHLQEQALAEFQKDGKLTAKAVGALKLEHSRQAEAEASVGLFNQEEQDSLTVGKVRDALGEALDAAQGARPGLFVESVVDTILAALVAVAEQPGEPAPETPPETDAALGEKDPYGDE